MRLNVLVVDDEPLARDGLKRLLGGTPRVGSVCEARNGSVAHGQYTVELGSGLRTYGERIRRALSNPF